MSVSFRVNGQSADYIAHVQRTSSPDALRNALVFCSLTGASTLKELGTFTLEVFDALGPVSYSCQATFLESDGEFTMSGPGIAVVTVHLE